MENEELGIKELKEMITMLGELAYTAGKVMKDDKVSAADLSHLPELIMKYPMFEAGIKDVSKALDEAKNLKEGEVMELIGCMYHAVNRFAEGKK